MMMKLPKDFESMKMFRKEKRKTRLITSQKNIDIL